MSAEKGDEAGAVLDWLLAFLRRKALEPEAAARLRSIRAHRLTLLVFERTAGLAWTDIVSPSGSKSRVRMPDPRTTAGQRLYVFDVRLGAGEFRADPAALSAIPEGVPVIFASVPVLCAIFVGSVKTPTGHARYDAQAAIQNGDADFLGSDIGDLAAMLEVFGDLVVAGRAELGIQVPEPLPAAGTATSRDLGTGIAAATRLAAEPERPRLFVPGSTGPTSGSEAAERIR